MEDPGARIAMEDIVIRPFQKNDRVQVRTIAWETGFMGEPSGVFFDDQEVLCDFLTLYFTDYEPESCFVAESSGKVIGYLIGARDVRVLSKIFNSKIVFRLLFKAVLRRTFWTKKNLMLIVRCVLGFLRGEFSTPDFSTVYPATLHINVEKDFQGKGAGSRLMGAYLNYLEKRKVPGVHLATMSQKGPAFFKKEGFEVLHRAERSYFHHITGQDICVLIFGKKIVSS